MSRHAPKGPIKVKTDPMGPGHPMTAQCSAHSKQTGARCKQPAIKGGTVCRYHGGAAPQVQKAAMERLKALQQPAVDALEKLLGRDEFPTVQLGAAKAVIDWTEGKATERIEQHVDGALTLTWQSS